MVRVKTANLCVGGGGVFPGPCVVSSDEYAIMSSLGSKDVGAMPSMHGARRSMELTEGQWETNRRDGSFCFSCWHVDVTQTARTEQETTPSWSALWLRQCAGTAHHLMSTNSCATYDMNIWSSQKSTLMFGLNVPVKTLKTLHLKIVKRHEVWRILCLKWPIKMPYYIHWYICANCFHVTVI